MKNIQNIVTGKSHEGIEHIDIHQKKSGFFDLPLPEKKCTHPDHNPPQHIHIPQGKGYQHICPACGAESILIRNSFHFKIKY